MKNKKKVNLRAARQPLHVVINALSGFDVRAVTVGEVGERLSIAWERAQRALLDLNGRVR